MDVYMCRNCKQFIIWGYTNKYNECFCSNECYENYCNKNNYKFNINDLSIIK